MKIKTLKEMTEGIITAIVIVVLPIVVFILVTSKIQLFGIQSFVVMSGSMQPTLPVGSVIFTQRAKSYGVGDIIAFKNADTTVTHRIVAVEKNGSFKTQGDANNTVDSHVVTSLQVVGNEIFMIPFIGRVIIFAKTLPGFIMFIVFPTLLFIGFELKNIKKEIEKEVEKKVTKRFENRVLSS